jgi:hypothetical protein
MNSVTLILEHVQLFMHKRERVKKGEQWHIIARTRYYTTSRILPSKKTHFFRHMTSNHVPEFRPIIAFIRKFFPTLMSEGIQLVLID